MTWSCCVFSVVCLLFQEPLSDLRGNQEYLAWIDQFKITTSPSNLTNIIYSVYFRNDNYDPVYNIPVAFDKNGNISPFVYICCKFFGLWPKDVNVS